MLNPFIISSIAEREGFREYTDREIWEAKCKLLGVSLEQCRAYDMAAWRYATTTVYPNNQVIAYLRKLACEALVRGDPWSNNIEQIIENENRRQLKRWFS